MGAGFKDFASEVLRSVDVDDYLMKQTVMSFATAAARDAAITTPEEGMHAYLADTNVVTYYDGTVWRQAWIKLETVDAKGDLLVGTADNAVSRLAVGADGAALIADSAEASGVKWGSAVTDRAVVAGFGYLTSNASGQMYRTVSYAASSTSGLQIPIVADRAGSIVGLSAVVTAAIGAGETVVVEAYINGVATGFTATVPNSGQYANSVQASGLDTFVAGDRIDLRKTSAATVSGQQVEAAVVLQYS